MGFILTSLFTHLCVVESVTHLITVSELNSKCLQNVLPSLIHHEPVYSVYYCCFQIQFETISSDYYVYINIIALWDVKSCSFVGTYRCFKGMYQAHVLR